MANLIERLRLALSPQFDILREIAGGGMAVVFLAHDVALDRQVAIKVLRPELATAVGVERFLREARLLARLRHPHIVPVFQGGNADGLLYHVLELQEGETLAQRLTRGPLSPGESESLATGLLAALGAAHEAGVVHRDIKPANIFLHDGRAVVGDFGIAATSTADESLTATGSTPGTAAYMAPEQVRGGPITPRTDLYAAGLVLFEAVTGQRYAGSLGRGAASGGAWRRWARCLGRALAEDPEARWDSASAMGASLRSSGRRWPIAVAGTALAILGIWILNPPPKPHQRFVLGLGAFEQAGAPRGTNWADSLRGELTARLAGFPDFVVDPDPSGAVTLRLSGRVEERDDSLRVEVIATSEEGVSRPLVVPIMPTTAWRAMVDSLTRGAILMVWHEDPYPQGALPITALGTERLFLAELARRDGAWDEARRAYEDAEGVDPTCLLCAYRMRDLDRWLNNPTDSANQARLLANLDRFPLEYRQVVVATTLPIRDRIDSLRSVTRQHREFFDGWYLLGDELLHRGPLVGESRAEALAALHQARHLRPDFAGVAEHLAWALIAEGSGDSARAVLDELARDHPPKGQFAADIRTFHELAWAWRFLPEPSATKFTQAALTDPRVASSPVLAAGPRALPALGVFRGAVGFGRLLADLDRPELARSGLLAEFLGATAQGEVALARATAETLRNTTDDPEWRLAPLQLGAIFLLLGDTLIGSEAIASQLRELEGRRGLTPSQSGRVRWTRSLLGAPVAPEHPDGPLGRLQRARQAAADGDLARALALTDGETGADYRAHDPAAGAVARLLRAEWFGALGRHADAANELLWAEHSDFGTLPNDRIQAAELDWAVGTEAAWRRAGHLEAEGSRAGELCRVYAEVARRWQHADAPFGARRDSARTRMGALGCRVVP